MLAGLAGPRLHETIPDFHNTPARFRRLQEAVTADKCGRLADCCGTTTAGRREKAATHAPS